MFTHTSESTQEQTPSNILVTGGAGYIGSVFVRRLLAAGYRVRVLDRLLYGAASVQDLARHARFEVRRGDCRRAGDIKQALNGVHAVVHLAAIVGDAACSTDERLTWQTNCEATEVMIRACRSAGVARMLLVSTCSVYGATDGEVNEESRLNPLSLYATSKAVAEKLAIASATDSFHPTVLRLGTAFGWSFRPRFDLVVNLLAAQSFREREIVICNRNQWRPFIHVADIARAFCLVLESPAPQVSGRIFNAGSSRMNHPLLALQEAIFDASPQTRVTYSSNSDPRDYRVCFDKIRRFLGFESEVSLREGVREIHEQLRVHPALDYTACLYHNNSLTPRRRQVRRAPTMLAGAA
jgi:nucleoside-diphosphate-sugar epimerase